MEVSAGLAPSEASLLSLQTAAVSPCPHVVSPLRVCVLTSFCSNSSHTVSGPPSGLHFNRITSLKTPISKYSPDLRSRG